MPDLIDFDALVAEAQALKELRGALSSNTLWAFVMRLEAEEMGRMGIAGFVPTYGNEGTR